jgi:hypothetical protein
MGWLPVRSNIKSRPALRLLWTVYGKRRKHFSDVSVVANRGLHVPITSLPTILGHPLPVFVQCANVSHGSKISEICGPLKPNQCLSLVAIRSNSVPVAQAEIVHLLPEIRDQSPYADTG